MRGEIPARLWFQALSHQTVMRLRALRGGSLRRKLYDVFPSKIFRNYDLKTPKDAEFRAESEFDDENAVALQKHFVFKEILFHSKSDEFTI